MSIPALIYSGIAILVTAIIRGERFRFLDACFRRAGSINRGIILVQRAYARELRVPR